MGSQPYNPLDKHNLAASIAEALLRQTPEPIDQIARFAGSGIYLIYYTGAHKSYIPLAERNRDGKFEWPVYVGKAIPSGARKGTKLPKVPKRPSKKSKVDPLPEAALFERLKEHRDSIRFGAGLDVKEFHYRFLLCDPLWIPLGESLMIAKFAPIWNTLLEGFGNHDPGSGRYNGKIPKWDVMHPGRAWAVKCKPRPETPAMLEAEVENALQMATVPHSPQMLIGSVKASDVT